MQKEILVVLVCTDMVALLNPWEETYGGGSIEYVGTVTATTYTENQVIGTPAGGFKSEHLQ